MSLRKTKSATIAFSLLLIMSASSAGFLIGRTAQVRKAMSEEQVRQVQEQVVSMGTIVSKGAAVIRRVILK